MNENKKIITNTFLREEEEEGDLRKISTLLYHVRWLVFVIVRSFARSLVCLLFISGCSHDDLFVLKNSLLGVDSECVVSVFLSISLFVAQSSVGFFSCISFFSS